MTLETFDTAYDYLVQMVENDTPFDEMVDKVMEKECCSEETAFNLIETAVDLIENS